MEYKTVNVETPIWKELKQLALDKNMTLQSEVNEILKAFLDCVKENKKDKVK
jgi:predicted DNA-binding ribbon-helix-helix protein